MKKLYIALIVLILTVAAVAALFYFKILPRNSAINSITPTASQTPVSSPSQSAIQNAYADPVADFRARVTKKPFGIYITPQNSPVQPERFTGYHTGTDAEYTDVTSDVPVYAVADGTVVLSEYVSGYGGVFMISFDLNDSPHSALYGHIRPTSLPEVGKKVTKGEQIGLLGTGYSSETDGERRHLHFAVLSDNRIDVKGYVQAQSNLSGWIDPLTILN